MIKIKQIRIQKVNGVKYKNKEIAETKYQSPFRILTLFNGATMLKRAEVTIGLVNNRAKLWETKRVNSRLELDYYNGGQFL